MCLACSLLTLNVNAKLGEGVVPATGEKTAETPILFDNTKGALHLDGTVDTIQYPLCAGDVV